MTGRQYGGVRENPGEKGFQTMPSSVDHPEHYNKHPSGVECIDIIEHWNFNLGSAVKYIWRHGLKPGADAIEDLKKAIWYLEREVERVGRED